MLKKMVLVTVLCFMSAARAEEGMYPMSDLHRLELKQLGFQCTADEIFNPDSISITDAIVHIGGCTGSFISSQGLILTNHHCAFGAIQQASTPEHDYLQNGFHARTQADEYPAKGYIVRITESYSDVSQQILDAMAQESDFAARTKLKDQKIKEIVAGSEKDNPGMRAEVAEMFPGRTYMLFIYTHLKDVRLVFAPPIGIGNYGGEEDNWVWPRHTGDFSIMRAYVGADGKAADFDQANVPYTPRVFLKIDQKGIQENDLAFILGYPGRTYRHTTSHYLEYESAFRMPWIVEWYGYQIEEMERMSQNDRAVALKLANGIKGLANTCKNYQGKLQGIRRLDLLQQRRDEEKQLQRFINADTLRLASYGQLLDAFASHYQEVQQTAGRDLILDALQRSSTLLQAAYTLYQASLELPKADLERESAFMTRNLDRTKLRLQMSLHDYYQPRDRLFLGILLRKLHDLPPALQPQACRLLPGKDKLAGYLDKSFAKSRLNDAKWVMQHFGATTDVLVRSKDPFILLARDLHPDYQALRELRRARTGQLDNLLAQYVEVKQAFKAQSFVPDANSTLRLTYGHIRGYAPRDAIYSAPFTTVRGMIEKNTGREPFDLPQAVVSAYTRGDFGGYINPALGQVPVDILYDMDTTGGNSGSPVLNARGELIGLNFDRAFEATINDYAWSADYSRSIGVDVRFILWVLDKVSGAADILTEMGVN